MRIRTVKPRIWQDEEIVTISRDARLLFVVLITMADDEGRFLAKPMAIAGHGYPEDEDALKRIPKWLAELETVGLVQLYGGRYGCLPNWLRHQKISHSTPSILPKPPEQCPNGSGELRELFRKTSGAAPS